MSARAAGWLPRHYQAVLLALTGGLLGLHPLAESDTFFHLMLGRAVLSQGSRVVREPTAFRAFSDPCVVPEWLWDVASYGLYRLGGYVALTALNVTCGAAAGVLLLWLARRVAGTQGAWALLPALLASSAVATRLSDRPQSAALVLLPAFLLLAYVYRDRARLRARAALGLAALALLWAQLHGSFVLAPLLLLLVLAGEAHGPSLAERVRRHGPLLLALALAATTSAYGLGIGSYVLAHAGGDAVRHIEDMKRLSWASLSPFAGAREAALLCLWSLGALGLWRRGLAVSELALALLGAALAYTAMRFEIDACVLALPLAARALPPGAGARAPGAAGVWPRVAAVALALWLPLWSRSFVDQYFGPWPGGGMDSGRFPYLASRYLRKLPRGTPVLTSYAAGAPLGFWLDGRVRTYVDGRTPMYFDDTDYAVARDLAASPEVLSRVIARYGARAAVIERDSPACELLAQRWSVVVAEPRFTTFVPAGSAPPLQGLSACGELMLAPDACAREPELRAAARRLRALADTPYTRFVEVAAAVQCAPQRAGRYAARLQDERAARTFLRAQRNAHVAALLATGELDRAQALVLDSIGRRWMDGLRWLTTPLGERVPLSMARRWLQRGIDAMDDSAPPVLRAQLAIACAAEGDAECARLQATRAALWGEPAALAPLSWVAQHHPSARARADARAWLALLRPAAARP